MQQIEIETLLDKSLTNVNSDLHLKVWRRRHIENYLLCPAAIARASGRSEQEVTDFMTEHALHIPPDFVSRNVADAISDARGKAIMVGHPRSVKSVFGVTPLQIAEAMVPDEVAEDVKYFIEFLEKICTG